MRKMRNCAQLIFVARKMRNCAQLIFVAREMREFAPSRKPVALETLVLSKVILSFRKCCGSRSGVLVQQTDPASKYIFLVLKYC